MSTEAQDSAVRSSEASSTTRRKEFVLQLYVAGSTQRSRRAISAVKRFCEQYLRDRYELEVIDVYQQPQLSSEQQVKATPTLVRQVPLPVRKISGDLSEVDRVLRLVGLVPDAS